ncbi:MAG: type IV pilus biogenesis protein PilM [Acidimicrobiales bacterium]
MSDALLALSIGPHELRAVQVASRRAGAPVTATATESLASAEEADAFDGRFEISRVEAAARRVLDRDDIDAERLVIGLSDTAALLRRTELPVAARGPLRDAAGLGVEELLSYPLDEAIFDVVELGRRDDDELRWVDALVVAVRSSIVEDLHAMCARLDVRLERVDLLPSSVGVSAGSERSAAVVEVEEDHTDVAIFDGDGLVFARTLAVGLGASGASMAAELEAHIQAITGQVHEVRHDEHDTGADRDLAAVAEAVRRALEHYTRTTGDPLPARVILLGARGSTAGLPDALDRALETINGHVEVAIGAPPTAFVADDWLSHAAAYGLTVGRTGRAFDLRAEGARRRRGRVQRLVVGLAAAAVVAVVACQHTLGARDRLVDLEARVDADQQAVVAVQTQVDDFGDLRDDADDVSRRAGQVEVLERAVLDLAGVTRQVAASMPDDSYLLALRLERLRDGVVPAEFGADDATASFSLTGVTADLGGVGRWLRVLETTKPFEGVWLSQSAHGPLGTDEVDATLFVVDGGVAP